MKLPILKEYFDAILNGRKEMDFRDAHITFQCQETGRQLVCDITGVKVLSKSISRLIQDKYSDLKWDDDTVVQFEIHPRERSVAKLKEGGQ